MKTEPAFGCRVSLLKDEPFQKIIDRSARLERQGYDTVLVDDHLLYGAASAFAPDPFVTAGSILNRTSHVRVGVMVTDLVRRHPAVIAQSAGTITALAPDRFILGLGGGDPMNHAPFALPVDHSFERFKEGVNMLKLLSGSSIKAPVSFTGRFHKLDNAYLQTGPLPPLYFAAFGEKMLRLAGMEADGWIPHCHTPETYRRDLDKILASAGQSGRTVRASYYTVASVSSDRGVADANALGPARYFLALIPEALRKVDPSFDHPGRTWEKVRDPREQRKLISEIASKIPEEVALSTVIHGTPSDCIEQLSRYTGQGCTEYDFMFAGEHGLWSPDASLSTAELFAREVIEYFHDKKGN